jgi:CRP-like cAMP-binding protein
MPTVSPLDGHSASIVKNLTLQSLTEDSRSLLLPYMEPVDLPQGLIMVRATEPIRWVYFLTRGMASITCLDAQGTAVEVGVIGREGAIGVQSLLGNFSTLNTIDVQSAGEGFRIHPEVLQRFLRTQPDLVKAVHRFLYAMLEQTSRLVLCNRLHGLENRLARWLLMTSDCIESPHLQLTQEFLAEMLGTARPGVTLAAGSLQRGGSIMYSRGRVEIRSRELLQAASCECYRTIRNVYGSVYPELY